MSERTARVVALATIAIVVVGAGSAAFAATGPEPTSEAAAKSVVIKKLKQIKAKVRKQLKKTPGNSINTSKLRDGAVTAAKLDPNALAFDIQDASITLDKLAPDSVDSSKIIDDSVTAGDINLSTISAFWRLDGNAGTDSSTDLLGTTDAEPLTIGVNDAPALRFEPATDGTSETPNLIGGTATNAVEPGVFGATISGGGESNAAGPAAANQVSDNFGTVGGGGNNRAGDPTGTTDDERYATVGGGQGNTATNRHSTVAGGLGNEATGTQSTVAGGQSNEATMTLSTSLGGFANDATGVAATIAGGQINEASGFESFIGSGQNNEALAPRAVIGGGNGNVVTATGSFGTIPGGFQNEAAGDFSFVAGNRAKNSNATHNGVFLFADSTAADIASTGANQFIARASGGFFLQDDSSIDDQSGFLNTSTGAHLTTGGAWTDSSDARLKRDFEPVSPRSVLARVAELPLATWSYEAEPGVTHLGPTAQDFHRAFGLGADDRHIAALDANGVSLAAIQALEARVDRLERALARERNGGR